MLVNPYFFHFTSLSLYICGDFIIIIYCDHQVIMVMNGMCLLSLPVHICTFVCVWPVPCFIMALVISMGHSEQCYCIKTKLLSWRACAIMEVLFPEGLVAHNILHIYKYISNHSQYKRILQPLSDVASICIFITIHRKVFSAHVFWFYIGKP